MKRHLLVLAGVWALSGFTASAQEAAPAAKLGKPAASLGKPVADDGQISRPLGVDVHPAAAIDFVPKSLPKGTVNETAPMLPMPAIPTAPMPMPSTPGPMVPGSPAPGISGPVLVSPTTPAIMSPTPGGPIPGVPMMVQPPSMVNGPIVAAPMGNCGDGGCATPGIPGLIDGAPINTQRWYVSGEYMLWFLKGYDTPPLVSVGPVSSNGILGNGATSIFPTERIDNNPMSGGRFSLGYWFSPKWAIETNFFIVRDGGDSFSTNSAEYPNAIIARPFFSLNQNAEFAEQVSNPGIYAGYVDVHHRSTFYGLDLNLRRHLYQTCDTTIDMIAGFRMLDLGDELIITEGTRGLAGAPQQFIGQSRVLTDSFKTKNQFYGAQIGAIFEQRWGRWSLGGQAKIALGGSVMTSSIAGGINTNGGFAPNNPGGLLALGSNISDTTATRLSYVPEVNLNLGYDVTKNFRVFVGYTFLYWSSVARPGAQIDRSLDENRIPDFTLGRRVPAVNSPRPLNVVNHEGFWAQGVSIGMIFRW